MSAERHGPSRRRFLAGSASALAIGALVAGAVPAAAQTDRDLLDLLYFHEQELIDLYGGVLNAFDESAFRDAGLPDGARDALATIVAAEEIHRAVVARPDQPETPRREPLIPDTLLEALRQAVELENLAVAAYAFVIPELSRQRLIPELLGILSVEARHAAWLAWLLGDDPFPDAIDAPLTLDDADPGDGAAAATPSGDAVSEDALQPILSAIAAELGVAPDAVAVVSATREVWPDAALGCPQPVTLYAQVLTPGFRVLVETGGESIAFHTDERGHVVRCS